MDKSCYNCLADTALTCFCFLIPLETNNSFPLELKVIESIRFSSFLNVWSCFKKNKNKNNRMSHIFKTRWKHNLPVLEDTRVMEMLFKLIKTPPGPFPKNALGFCNRQQIKIKNRLKKYSIPCATTGNTTTFCTSLKRE